MNLSVDEELNVKECFTRLPLQVQASFAEKSFTGCRYELKKDKRKWRIKDLGNLSYVVLNKNKYNIETQAWGEENLREWSCWFKEEREKKWKCIFFLIIFVVSSQLNKK